MDSCLTLFNSSDVHVNVFLSCWLYWILIGPYIDKCDSTKFETENFVSLLRVNILLIVVHLIAL